MRLANDRLKLGFGDSAGADAARANPHSFVGLSNKHPNALKVRIPAPTRQIVGVTDPVPIYRAFVADFTTRHEGHLPRDKCSRELQPAFS